LFHSDPRKTRAKLLENQLIKTNQQKKYEKQVEKQNKFQQLLE